MGPFSPTFCLDSSGHRISRQFFRLSVARCRRITAFQRYKARLGRLRLTIGPRLLARSFGTPFEELELLCKINDLAAEHSDSDDFSRLIRSKRYLINRAVARFDEQDSNGRVLY